MSQDNVYLFQVYIDKCNISVDQQGQISLFLRVGKTISSIMKSKQRSVKCIRFQSVIKCNCDQNALDTKRFSLTLNIKGHNKQKQILGIVMIHISQKQMVQTQTYKISQSQDSNATIELRYSIKLINQNLKHNNSSGSTFQMTTKNLRNSNQNKQKQQPNPQLLRISNPRKRSINLLDPFIFTPNPSKLPTSQFVSEVEILKKQFLQENKVQKQKLIELNQILQRQNKKLKRQKEFLKELLAIQNKKYRYLNNFLANTFTILTQKWQSEYSHLNFFDKNIIEENSEKLRQSMGVTDNKFALQSLASFESLLQNSTLSPDNEMKQKSDKIGMHQSKITLSKIGIINTQFSNLLRESATKDRSEQKTAIMQLKKALMDETDLKHQRRLRSVKIKIQKSYLQLLNSPQPYLKEQIMKHKISVNKILDELIMSNIIA